MVSKQLAPSRAKRDVRCVLVEMPLVLKEVVVRAVEERETSLNDLVVALLARTYGIGFDPGGGRGSPDPAKQQVLLRMPQELKYAIQVDALTHQSNLTDTINRVVARALDVALDLPPPRRKSPFGGGPRTRP